MFSADLQNKTLLSNFENGSVKTGTVYLNSDADSRVTARVEALGPIKVGEYGHSILVQLPSETAEAFKLFEDEAKASLPDSIEYKEFLRDSKFFLKLSIKDDAYKATMIPPVIPAEAEKSTIKYGSILDIVFKPNVWISLDKGTAGIYLNVIQIECDSKKKIIKRK
jgi:hypothetical protein